MGWQERAEEQPIEQRAERKLLVVFLNQTGPSRAEYVLYGRIGDVQSEAQRRPERVARCGMEPGARIPRMIDVNYSCSRTTTILAERGQV